MSSYSKKLDWDNGIRTVVLIRTITLLGPRKWYCRFSKQGDPLGPLYFFDAEHVNKFTAYRLALDKAKIGYVPKHY